jgi:hypothetical protein
VPWGYPFARPCAVLVTILPLLYVLANDTAVSVNREQGVAAGGTSSLSENARQKMLGGCLICDR